jgi:gluconokinase
MSSTAQAASAWAEAAAPRLVVMGVSGCGKSTIGRELAQTLQLPYVEGDELHPARNVALMAAGTPLTDADRAQWLDAVAASIARAASSGLVISCSALKRAYRERLREAAPGLRFVYLRGTPELLASRMAQRKGHYMPASLLQSQLLTLEVPGADEAVLVADIGSAPSDIVAALCAQLTQPFPETSRP